MVTIRSRGENVQLNESIKLIARFYSSSGVLADLDSFPLITIVQPSGAVLLGPTSAGVSRDATGTYSYILPVQYNQALGVYYDVWQGSMGGNNLVQEYNFIVLNTQMQEVASDGYMHLGEDVGFNYSQNAILNINKLMKGVRARLNTRGKAKTKDEFGNVVYEDCDLFSTEQLVIFIAGALTAFNEIPHFTFFTFEDNDIIDLFYDVLVNYAVILAIESKIAIERGRELQINDSGVTFTPPGVSDILNSIYGTQLNHWFEKVKLIKANMKPGPLGLGTMRSLGSSPQLMRLRHLRQRQIV